jgi:hypothetical protein
MRPPGFLISSFFSLPMATQPEARQQARHHNNGHNTTSVGNNHKPCELAIFVKENQCTSYNAFTVVFMFPRNVLAAGGILIEFQQDCCLNVNIAHWAVGHG